MSKNKKYESMSPDERIFIVENMFIKHPRFQLVYKAIEECHKKSKKAAEPRCFFITGESGSGKTTLVNHYASQYPQVRTDEGLTIPVLTSTIFAPATVKSMATAILASMGDPLADRGTITSLTMRLQHFIKACAVELIILDEFQHLIDRDSNKVLQTASDWLKNLLNETRIPMVLIGLPSSDQILVANEQLQRRFSARKNLESFKWKTTKDKETFRALLKVIDGQLPFDKSCNFADHDMALRFFCATQGIIAHLMKIVRRAAELAIRKSHDNINQDQLAAAYDDEMSGYNDLRENPFIADLEQVEKIVEAKPSEKNAPNKLALTATKLKKGFS